MKKMISLISAAALVLSSGTITTFAEETAVPADVPEEVYAQLLDGYNKYCFDTDSDGVVTEEELTASSNLELDLDTLTDLGFLSKFTSCRYLDLKNGNITDISAVREMPALRIISLDNVPLEDLAALKGLDLLSVNLQNMDKISLEDKMDIITWSEAKTYPGFAADVMPSPSGLLYGEELSISIDDETIATKVPTFYSSERFELYGLNAGKTSYTLYSGETPVYTAEVSVEDFDVFDPELHDSQDTSKLFHSEWYSDHDAVMEGGSLFGIKGDQAVKHTDDAKDMTFFYEKDANGDYFYYDMLLLNDGTLQINGQNIDELKFDRLIDKRAVTADNELYIFYDQNGIITPVKIGSDFAKECYDSNSFYVSTSGEVIWYYITYDLTGGIKLSTANTGIMNPISNNYRYFVDENGVLWDCNYYKSFSKNQRAENAAECGYYYDVNGASFYGYKTKDGKYLTMNGNEMNVGDPFTFDTVYSDDGSFYIHQLSMKVDDGNDTLIRWFIGKDGTFTINFKGQCEAISNVSKTIGTTYDEESEKSYVWFIRTDGSIWNYCVEDDVFNEVWACGTAPVKGDVNGDGEFNIADAVTFQRWLLADGTELTDSSAGELTGDDKLNVYDLIIMKEMLVD